MTPAMRDTIQVLLIEDELIDQLAFSRFVQREHLPYETVVASSIPEARATLAQHTFDVVITDFHLGPDTAFDLLEEIHHIPCIVITGLGDEEIAVRAMKLGASDYLAKDMYGNYLKTLPTVVENAIRLKAVEAELIQYREGLERMVAERTEALTQANQLLRQEINERKQAEAQVLLQATALESTVNGIMITNPDGEVVWINTALETMTGYALREIVGGQPHFIKGRLGSASPLQIALNNAQKGLSWHGEVRLTRKNGWSLTAEMTFTPVISEEGRVTHCISICQDITERIEAKQKLEYMASHDMLTDLPNRMLFYEYLDQALAKSRRTGRQGAVLLIDLDDFKAINDAFSHDDGDEYLKLIAHRFQEFMHENHIVARIGGDEFAILVEDVFEHDVGALALRVNQFLAEPAEIRENTIVSTASIGISIFPEDGETIPILLKNADLAMYEAKINKNTFAFYQNEMSARVKNQLELKNYLRHALQNGVFQLYYQPQIDAQTGKVIGLEALLRLPHPTQVWVPPSEFIPLAEKAGFVALIDEWVLRAAAQKLKELQASGFKDITMSVNLTAQILNQPRLFTVLNAVLKENDLEPSSLVLEISEGSVFHNVEKAIATLVKLKSMGVKLAIDDFGTGYASLNYLSRFPLDSLKIDLSFTQKVLTSRNDVAIVKGVVAIAKSLGLEIIVEGVEKKEQLDFFTSLDCRLIQGYYFSRPVPGSDLESLLCRPFKDVHS